MPGASLGAQCSPLEEGELNVLVHSGDPARRGSNRDRATGRRCDLGACQWLVRTQIRDPKLILLGADGQPVASQCNGRGPRRDSDTQRFQVVFSSCTATLRALTMTTRCPSSRTLRANGSGVPQNELTG